MSRRRGYVSRLEIAPRRSVAHRHAAHTALNVTLASLGKAIGASSARTDQSPCSTHKPHWELPCDDLSVQRFAAFSIVLVALVAGGVTIALAASSSAGTLITKTQAAAFAQAVNLAASDLPGSSKLELHITCLSRRARLANGEAEVLWPKRFGALVPTLSAIGQSTKTSRLEDSEHDIVGSIVRVMPTEAIVTKELTGLASKRGHACFARAATLPVSSENEPAEAPGPIKATFIPLVKLLRAGAIGVHTLSKVPDAKTSAGIHNDGVIFRVGPAEILFATLGKQRFPPATRRRLLSLLHNRAKAHKLQQVATYRSVGPPSGDLRFGLKVGSGASYRQQLRAAVHSLARRRPKPGVPEPSSGFCDSLLFERDVHASNARSRSNRRRPRGRRRCAGRPAPSMLVVVSRETLSRRRVRTHRRNEVADVGKRRSTREGAWRCAPRGRQSPSRQGYPGRAR